ncbi:unnamed protein product [Cuscuta campestris]|uniref:UBC core domain-containing protein n=1 Tax=Cuscuta campestris TaxID=132261 RepID=A0A484MIX0_9ASTE|nr:unnamed protein product [Cuscuta campestris]
MKDQGEAFGHTGVDEVVGAPTVQENLNGCPIDGSGQFEGTGTQAPGHRVNTGHVTGDDGSKVVLVRGAVACKGRIFGVGTHKHQESSSTIMKSIPLFITIPAKAFFATFCFLGGGDDHHGKRKGDYDVGFINEDVTMFTVKYRAPNGSLYQGYEFQVMVELEDGYPTKPLIVYFQTKILHPNIDYDSGFICVTSLDNEEWDPRSELSHIFDYMLPHAQRFASSMRRGRDGNGDVLDYPLFPFPRLYEGFPFRVSSHSTIPPPLLRFFLASAATHLLACSIRRRNKGNSIPFLVLNQTD